MASNKEHEGEAMEETSVDASVVTPTTGDLTETAGASRSELSSM